MPFTITSDPLPLASDSEGVVRVGGTRVTLDTVVAAFQEGLSAEGLVEQYPSLRLADVYSLIGYYLDHRSEVEAYLRARRQAAAVVQEQNESQFDPNGIRARLIARRPRTAP